MSTKPRHEYYVYILSNGARTLYVGVTNNLVRRVYAHKQKKIPGFTKKYNTLGSSTTSRLPKLYQHSHGEANQELRRGKKVELIESLNPHWHDLSAEWYEMEKQRLRFLAEPRNDN